MPLVVYSLLRLALFGACWWLLAWAGLDPWLAVVAAAFIAWGLSYVALPGPRDAAARWLAERDAARRARGGRPALSARARRDADDEDAQVEAQAPPEDRGPEPGPEPGPESGPEPGPESRPEPGPGQSARPSPSSTP